MTGLLSWAEDFLSKSPSGVLSVSMCRQYPQFYRNEKGFFDGAVRIPAKRVYLSSKEQEVVQGLAQKAYLSKVVEDTKQKLEAISTFLSRYDGKMFPDMTDSLSEHFCKYIKPIYPADDLFIEQWLNFWPEPPNSYPIKGNNYTNKKEHVRSKSEKIIADELNYRGIPYKYECGRRSKCTGIVRYPDFSCMNVRERKEIIWEHLGMWDNDNYVIKNGQRLVEFQEDGFFVGDNLILTFENDDFSLDSRMIDRIIDKFLI